MFARNVQFLANNWPSFIMMRTYKYVKTKPVRKLKNDNVKGNPGTNRMLAMVLDGESPDVSNVTLTDVEDGENDMLDSHLLYDQHMKEMRKQKRYKSFQNIKRKYFKMNPVLPNFLTYFEKQQIKTLHEKSPNEWTPETLSTCFPASPEIIIKILKSKWIADEGQQIFRHDKLVQQNWESFRNGSFKDILSDELKNHLAKFSERCPSLVTLEQAENHIPKLASDYLKPEEFGQIITDYIGGPINQSESLQIESKEEHKFDRISENDTKTNIKKKHFTLNELKQDKKNEELFSWYSSTTLPSNEKSVNVSSVETDLKESTSVISRREVSKFIDTMNDYPLAIRIPKRVWKEGIIYKVKDCFYDDNGDFLYRVPGLITDEDKQEKQ